MPKNRIANTQSPLSHHAAWRFIFFFLGGNSSRFVGGLPTPARLSTFSAFGISARAARAVEVVRRPECRKFLRHRYGDQLVQRYSFSFRELTRFFEERRLKPQHKITLPHDFPPSRGRKAMSSGFRLRVAP
jgi:hypothetical protein